MKQHDIDFDEIPEYIGKRKGDRRGDRRDYKAYDIPGVLTWMCDQLPHDCADVQLTVCGRIPAWMWMAITCELRDRVDALYYTTSQMADSVRIFPEE